MNGLSWGSVSVAVMVAVALLGALGAIWGTLRSLCGKVTLLIKGLDKEHDAQIRVWRTVELHGRQLENHEGRIGTLEAK